MTERFLPTVQTTVPAEVVAYVGALNEWCNRYRASLGICQTPCESAAQNIADAYRPEGL